MPADHGLHVLVVDDSAVVRRFMSSVLAQERGTTVETASDPIFAMQRMEKRRPDVIVLDIEMPRMNGLTFLRKIMSEDPIPVDAEFSSCGGRFLARRATIPITVGCQLPRGCSSLSARSHVGSPGSRSPGASSPVAIRRSASTGNRGSTVPAASVSPSGTLGQPPSAAIWR